MGYTSERSGRRTKRARLALVAVVCACLLAVLVYSYSSAGGRDVRPVKRSLVDFWVTWRCLACGYEVEDRAGAGPRLCPNCGRQELYVCIRHACPKHGVFPVAFQYDEDGNPQRLKVADGGWVPYADEDLNVNARCPVCGEFMLPAETPRPVPSGEADGASG